MTTRKAIQYSVNSNGTELEQSRSNTSNGGLVNYLFTSALVVIPCSSRNGRLENQRWHHKQKQAVIALPKITMRAHWIINICGVILRNPQDGGDYKGFVWNVVETRSKRKSLKSQRVGEKTQQARTNHVNTVNNHSYNKQDRTNQFNKVKLFYWKY